MASEKFANAATSTLNGAITSSATSLVVSSAALFPSTPQFRIIIDTEIMLVTGVSGTTFTVSRGNGGTTAASHANTAVVTQILTKEAINQIISDNSQLGSVNSIPANEKSGRIYRTSDSPYAFFDDGTNWHAFEHPELTLPIFSQWTLTNAKSGPKLATLSNTYGAMWLYGPPDTNDSNTMVLKAIPSTPYKCTFKLKPYIAATNYSAYGVLWYQSSNDYLKGVYCYSNTQLSILEVGAGLDGNPHITSIYETQYTPQLWEWFQLEDDGSNQTFFVSPDGFNWIQLYQSASNSDLTPDHVGFFINPRNTISSPAAVSLLSYSETA